MVKKLLTSSCLAFICIMLLLFASCSSAKTSGSGTVASQSISTASEGTEDKQEEQTEKVTEKQTEVTTETTEESVKSSLTLEGIKKSTKDAGYGVEEAQDFKMGRGPEPVDGFYVVYKEEFYEANIPVFEFKNAEDAQTFAKETMEAGYGLSITNGKFLTTTGARYGVILNDKENALLESLLESKVMEYVEPGPAPAYYSRDYAGACSQRDAIYKALDKLVNKSVLLYDKALPKDDPKRLDSISFSLLGSGDLSFTAALSEDQTQLDAVVKLWEMFGVENFKIKHDAANEYVLTGKRAGMDTTFEIHCSYSPEKGSLRLVDKDGGQVGELYEFVPLGGDKYAFQTLFQRGIVEYRDGKILSFTFSMNKHNNALAYSIEKESIYPDGQGVGEAWVAKKGEDSYEQFITFDGNKLKIAADSFMGDRKKVDLDINQ